MVASHTKMFLPTASLLLFLLRSPHGLWALCVIFSALRRGPLSCPEYLAVFLAI